jgi:hypothetical protein
MKVIILLALCLFLAGCRANDSSTSSTTRDSSTPTSDSTPLPVGDAEERLAVAARIRSNLRDQAKVIVNGTKLVVNYRSASIDDAPDAFISQQGKAGMARIADAGFETLIISAQDASGVTQTKELSVAQYRTR